MAEWEERYKEALREFVAKKGRPVQFAEKRYDWQDEDDVSTYGWVDSNALDHCTVAPESSKYPEIYGDCSWVVPPGAVLYEREYSMFDNTYTGNKDEVGINVKGCHCACGKYTETTLRYVGTLAEVMQTLFGIEKRAEVTL